MKPKSKIVASIAGAVLLVLLVAVVSFGAFIQIESAAEARAHSYEIINRGNALMTEMLDAETGERGFALTGDEAFLAPYLAVRDNVKTHLAELIEMTRIAPARERLTKLDPLIDAKLKEMARMIELRHMRDLSKAPPQVNSGQGKRIMDAFRVELGAFIEMENAALRQRDAELQSRMRDLFTLIVIATLLTLVLSLFFAYLLYRETLHRLDSEVHKKTRHLLFEKEEVNKKLYSANRILQVSEEHLAVILHSIGDAVIATDEQGRVTHLNPTAERLTGWKRVEAAGRQIEEVFRIINQDTRQPSTVPVMSALIKGTVQGLANHTILVSRDGSECSIADSCAPIREPDGRIVGAVLVFRDVTDEYAAQQALRDSAALIRTILETVGDGMITITASGGVVETVNPAAERLFGYNTEELVGKNLGLLIPELDGDQRNAPLEYYGISDESRAMGLGREVVGRRKDGSHFPLEISVSEMWLGGKRYFTGVLRDVTVRQRVEAERNEAMAVAAKASRAKTEFLSGMSHELRTPLNAVLGFAQLMESGTPGPTPLQKRNLDQILKAGWYLLELINEILDLSLIESGKVTLSREPVSLSEVMLECRAMIEPQAQKRGIGMSFPRFDVRHFVSADRTRVKQVLINLLFNAIKYNKAEGAVAVELSPGQSNSIRISVRDTGDGMTPEQLSQLFQPFNRLGKESSTEEGTGIGLVVTKRLVELMGGRIGVQCAVGVGSVFWVEFNLIDAPALSVHEPEPAVQATLRGPRGMPQRTLLYVEDNPANLELVEQLVARRNDLRLVSAAEGNIGIEFARVYQPEVILMDINLPGINGIEAMQVLRADPTTSHIPIIALSANAIPRDVERALAAGFFNYLTKPIKVDKFMEALDAALAFVQTNQAKPEEKEQT